MELTWVTHRSNQDPTNHARAPIFSEFWRKLCFLAYANPKRTKVLLFNRWSLNFYFIIPKTRSIYLTPFWWIKKKQRWYRKLSCTGTKILVKPKDSAVCPKRKELRKKRQNISTLRINFNHPHSTTTAIINSIGSHVSYQRNHKTCH